MYTMKSTHYLAGKHTSYIYIISSIAHHSSHKTTNNDDNNNIASQFTVINKDMCAFCKEHNNLC